MTVETTSPLMPGLLPGAVLPFEDHLGRGQSCSWVAPGRALGVGRLSPTAGFSEHSPDRRSVPSGFQTFGARCVRPQSLRKARPRVRGGLSGPGPPSRPAIFSPAGGRGLDEGIPEVRRLALARCACLDEPGSGAAHKSKPSGTPAAMLPTTADWRSRAPAMSAWDFLSHSRGARRAVPYR